MISTMDIVNYVGEEIKFNWNGDDHPPSGKDLEMLALVKINQLDNMGLLELIENVTTKTEQDL